MNDTTEFRLAGPADLAAAVPYLLGFTPEHSLVAVGLKGANLECTFRVDLPGSIDHLDHLNTLAAQVETNACDGIVLIAYGETELATACIERAGFDFVRAGIRVLDRLLVADGRWFSLACTDGCCPAEGRPIPDTTAVTTALTAAGAQRHDNREAITALLNPAPADQRAAVAAALDAALLADAEAERPWAEQRATDLHTIDHVLAARDLPDPGLIADAALALGDIQVRDYALRVSDLRTDETGPAVDLWLWITRHLDDDLAAPPATIAGWCAYRSGNGVLALECFERALAADPNYRLAHTLMAALQAGIPPRALDRLTAASDDTETASSAV